MAEDLASRGYIVVTIDHTHDADEVEFPDGRVEVRTIPAESQEVNTAAVAVRRSMGNVCVERGVRMRDL